MQSRRKGQRAAVLGESSTEQQRTLHTNRHLQSGSPCLTGEQAEGLQASGEGQCQGGSSGERMGEKTKRPGFPRERLRQAPFSAHRMQLPRAVNVPTQLLAACHRESPSALLGTHTNPPQTPPSSPCLLPPPPEACRTQGQARPS